MLFTVSLPPSFPPSLLTAALGAMSATTTFTMIMITDNIMLVSEMSYEKGERERERERESSMAHVVVKVWWVGVGGPLDGLREVITANTVQFGV